MELPTDAVKKPNVYAHYTAEQIEEIRLCKNDPLYFMKNYMQIQHPVLGSLPFEPYPFQERMISAFHENRFCCVLASRQIGKCFSFYTKVAINGNNIHVGALIPQDLRQKVVNWLENILLRLSL